MTSAIRHIRITPIAFRDPPLLNAAARARPRPIPFYGELGFIYPVIATSESLQAIQPHAMLTQAMRQALDHGMAKQLAAGAKAC